MDRNRKLPIGIELVRRGIVTEEQINEAVEYQKTHRKNETRRDFKRSNKL